MKVYVKDTFMDKDIFISCSSKRELKAIVKTLGSSEVYSRFYKPLSEKRKAKLGVV